MHNFSFPFFSFLALTIIVVIVVGVALYVAVVWLLCVTKTFWWQLLPFVLLLNSIVCMWQVYVACLIFTLELNVDCVVRVYPVRLGSAEFCYVSFSSVLFCSLRFSTVCLSAVVQLCNL